MAVAMPLEEVGTPLWWLRRLHARIVARRPALAMLTRYYDGEFEWRYHDQKLRHAFGSIFYAARFGVNWMRLVVHAPEERLRVEGFRTQVEAADRRAWEIWQRNDMDERSSEAHLETILSGEALVTVWPDQDGYPEITLSSPAEAVLEVDPMRSRGRQRLAGLRLYRDGFGFLRAQLFLPQAVYMLVSDRRDVLEDDPARIGWVVDDSAAPQGIVVNPWGVVPMVALQNVPRRQAQEPCVRSEIWPVMPVQDKINSLVMNTLLVANTQGYRQRYVTGLELRPRLDGDGNPIPGEFEEPFRGGVDRLMVSENPDTRFGEFSATDIRPLLEGMEKLAQNIASISATPAHYLTPSADRLSGESIRAAESGLVAKVRRKQLAFGDSWEEVMRLCGLVLGDRELAEAADMETRWANPETRVESRTADAAIKLQQAGVPWRELMEFLGYSPQEIDRMSRERVQEMLLQPAPASALPGPGA